MLTILSSIVQTQQAATNPTRQSAATENPMMMKAAEMPPKERGQTFYMKVCTGSISSLGKISSLSFVGYGWSNVHRVAVHRHNLKP